MSENNTQFVEDKSKMTDTATDNSTGAVATTLDNFFGNSKDGIVMVYAMMYHVTQMIALIVTLVCFVRFLFYMRPVDIKALFNITEEVITTTLDTEYTTVDDSFDITVTLPDGKAEVFNSKTEPSANQEFTIKRLGVSGGTTGDIYYIYDDNFLTKTQLITLDEENYSSILKALPLGWLPFGTTAEMFTNLGIALVLVLCTFLLGAVYRKVKAKSEIGTDTRENA